MNGRPPRAATELARQLPHMQALLDSAAMHDLVRRYSREEVTAALRQSLGELRAAIQAGRVAALPDFSGRAFAASLAEDIEAARQSSLRPVINATGILLHTNMGRAPLAAEALAAIEAAARGYSNLELDLSTGKRGSRGNHVEQLICELTGAEAALVVNNCAAAVLFCLTATAAGRNVVASRGELIEIGGSFRLPDVIAASGADLVEVGATNRTRLKDYKAGLDDETAVLLKSHTSNFQIVGFTETPSRSELAGLARETGTLLIEDLGSGVLIDLEPYGLGDEPVVSDILRQGVDLVMFSGDKLLGGPQAGIIAGRAQIVEALRGHPIARALRIDKLSLAALEATLRLYLPPHDPVAKIPVLRMLAEDTGSVKGRAEALASRLVEAGVRDVQVAESTAYAGGGSLPQTGLSSHAVSLELPSVSPHQLAARLRDAPCPLIGRIKAGRFQLDLRTVNADDLDAIASAVAQAMDG